MICFTMNFELCENILLTGRGCVFEANGKSGGCAGAASIGGRGESSLLSNQKYSTAMC